MKRIVAFLLAMLMLLSLAACGSDIGEKRDVSGLKAAETAEPTDDSGSDKEKSEKKSASSKTENTKKPVNNDYDDDYDYDYYEDYYYEDEAYQYIETVHYGYYDDYGDYVETYSYTYYICSNCGYEGSSCPDYCGGCGAYFYDWDWEDVYYDDY